MALRSETTMQDSISTYSIEDSVNVAGKLSENFNPFLKVILEGVYDDQSSLSRLRGTPHIVRLIWLRITDYWKSLIKVSSESLSLYVGRCVSEEWPPTPKNMTPGSCEYVPVDNFVLEVDSVTFPPSQNLNINMMPFVLDGEFGKCYLPEELRPYHKSLIEPLLRSYQANCRNEQGKVCYLTVHESLVTCNQSQRRPGLHTDNPGSIMIQGVGTSGEVKQVENHGESKGNGTQLARFYEHHWGMGVNLKSKQVEGGIYMASNVENSCAVWNSRIRRDTTNGNTEIIGRHGDVEHLRNYIGKREVMKANTIYWITDRTPHESLPLKNETYRQYFRLVTHHVSLWFEDHSTKNPLGIVPDPKITKIVQGSKFGDKLRITKDCLQNELKDELRIATTCCKCEIN